MLNVHCLYECGPTGESNGCGYIRLIQPFCYSGIEKQLNVTFSNELPEEGADVIIIERLWRPDVNMSLAMELVAEIKKRRATLIYTIDDNLIDLNSDRPWLAFPSDAQRNIIRYFAKEADGLIVSTNNLGKRLSKLNSNIKVVPNALDDSLFARPTLSAKLENQNVRIGYMGTPTHQKDLLMVLEPLRDVLSDYKESVSMEIVGVLEDHHAIELFNGLNVEVVEPQNYQYPKFAEWLSSSLEWDFAIAPLANNYFNSFKSDIKFLDYSILGIPGVYSNVDAYKYTVRHKETGLLVDNNVADWYCALKNMVENRGRRKALAANAKAYVLDHRTLKVCASHWIQSVVSIHRT